MIIKLIGTKSGETAQLVKVRKPEGPLLKGEFAYQKDAESPITAYRKKLSNEIADFQLNRVTVRKGVYEDKPTRTYSLRITYGGKSHIVDLGGGMTAQSIVNSLISFYGKETKEGLVLSNLPQEVIEASDLSVSFYNNKEGYCAAAVRKAGELLEWSMSNEVKNQYVDTAMAFGKELKNYDRLDQKFEELVAKLNEILPQGASSGHNALDEEEEEGTTSTQNTSSNIPFDDATSDAEVEV